MNSSESMQKLAKRDVNAKLVSGKKKESWKKVQKVRLDLQAKEVVLTPHML